MLPVIILPSEIISVNLLENNLMTDFKTCMYHINKSAYKIIIYSEIARCAK